MCSPMHHTDMHINKRKLDFNVTRLSRVLEALTFLSIQIRQRAKTHELFSIKLVM